MTTSLSDEVWQSLDRDAGRMPRRTFAILMSGAVIVGALAAVGLVGWRSGVLWPNIARDPSSAGWTIDTEHRSFELTFPVRNNGLVPADIRSVGRSGRGLDLVRSQITRSHLTAGATAEISVTYRVTDCGAVEAGAWPVPLAVSRGRTAYVEPPEMTGADTPSSYTYTGRNPYAVEWQVKLADLACGLIPMS